MRGPGGACRRLRRRARPSRCTRAVASCGCPSDRAHAQRRARRLPALETRRLRDRATDRSPELAEGATRICPSTRPQATRDRPLRGLTGDLESHGPSSQRAGQRRTGDAVARLLRTQPTRQACTPAARAWKGRSFAAYRSVLPAKHLVRASPPLGLHRTYRRRGP